MQILLGIIVTLWLESYSFSSEFRIVSLVFFFMIFKSFWWKNSLDPLRRCSIFKLWKILRQPFVWWNFKLLRSCILDRSTKTFLYEELVGNLSISVLFVVGIRFFCIFFLKLKAIQVVSAYRLIFLHLFSIRHHLVIGLTDDLSIISGTLES